MNEDSRAPEPFFANGGPDGTPNGDTKTCRRCAEVNDIAEHQCIRCGAVLPGNQIARKTPLPESAPADLLAAAAGDLERIIAERGGADAMPALDQLAAKTLVDAKVVLDLLHRRAAAELTASAGRASDTLGYYLQAVDRVLRLLGVVRPGQSAADAETSAPASTACRRGTWLELRGRDVSVTLPDDGRNPDLFASIPEAPALPPPGGEAETNNRGL